MELVFVTEARFIKNSKGEFYGDYSYNYILWKRYLTSFNTVKILARVQYIKDYKGDVQKKASGDGVEFIEIPFYIGPLGFLKKRKEIHKVIKNSINNNNVYICRIPGNIGNIAIKYLNECNIPFGVEVVGDPWDVFAPGSIKHPLRFYFRIKGYLDLKRNVFNAAAILYVTQKTLQQRYPIQKGVFSTSVSDVIVKNNLIQSDFFNISDSNVRIDDDLILLKPKKHVEKKQYLLISVGSLEQMYKAPDVVLKTIKRLNNTEICFKLIWLGDGIYKKKIQDLAKQLCIDEFVDFKGNVSAEDVRDYMLQSDVFILASRTEGLPRVVIEAMASGLPCVGTNVGGIPELLESTVLVPKNDPQALFEKIKDLITNPDFYNEQAERNLIESMNYSENILSAKRKKFYEYLINFKKNFA
jgi:glycosyltransferase involved in cell wall biosynthesis